MNIEVMEFETERRKLKIRKVKLVVRIMLSLIYFKLISSY
jgi:hypothetical protein